MILACATCKKDLQPDDAFVEPFKAFICFYCREPFCAKCACEHFKDDEFHKLKDENHEVKRTVMALQIKLEIKTEENKKLGRDVAYWMHKFEDPSGICEQCELGISPTARA